MTPREELLELRRLDELEAKAGQFASPTEPEDMPEWKKTLGRFMPQAVRDVGRSLGKGVPWADELSAALDTAFGIGEGKTYDENLALEKKRSAAVPLEIAIPGQIAGGVAATVAAAPAMAAAIPARVAQVAGRLPGWLQATGVGAGAGAAYGSGEAMPGERLAGAGVGAGLGAGIGAAGYPIMKGAGLLYDAGKGAVQRWANPETAALGRFSQAMGRDETTAGRMGARLRELGPQATLADVGGENVTSLARAAAGTPGPAKNRASMVLKGRTAGESERIGKSIQKGLEPEDYFLAEDQLVDKLRSRAAPYYEEAYKRFQAIDTPEVNRVLETPAGRQALKGAAQKMQNDMTLAGRVDPELTAALKEAAEVGLAETTGSGVAKGLKLRTLDYVKRELDDMIEAAKRSGRKDDARIFTGLKGKLVSSLDDATGGANSPYAKARQVYGEDATVLKALEEGRDFTKLDPEIIGRQLAKLPDAAKEAYRSGAARAIMDIVNKTPDTASAATRLYNNSLMRQRLRAVFPDQASYNGIAKTLTAEMRFKQTENRVLGGSPTAEKLAEQKDLGGIVGSVGSILGSNIPGTHSLVGAAVGRKIINSLGGSDEAVNRTLVKMLLSRNQAENQRILAEVAKRDPQQAKVARDAFNRITLMMASQQAAAVPSRSGAPR